MKTLGILVILGVLGGNLYAAQNRDGTTYINPTTWRSTNTASAIAGVFITTCPIDFGGVFISSPGSGVGDASPRVGIYDGSNNLILSTISATALSAYPYGQGVKFSSSGLRFTNTGTSPAAITILYNYRGMSCTDPYRVW